MRQLMPLVVALLGLTGAALRAQNISASTQPRPPADRRVLALASARTGITGSLGSSWTEGTASRAEARMKLCLKFGCAIDSVAQTKRVPSCTPAAPMRAISIRLVAARDTLIRSGNKGTSAMSAGLAAGPRQPAHMSRVPLMRAVTR